MKMIQKWRRPTDFNAKKLKSVFELFQSGISNCAAGCKHAVWTGQPGSAVGVFQLKLSTSFLTQHFLIGSCVIELSNIVGASVSNTLR